MKKFTVIDTLIVLAAIVVLAAGALILGGGKGATQKGSEVYFTVLASDVQSGIGDLIKAEDEVSISFSEQAFATVVSVSEEPYKESEFLPSKGSYVTNEIEGRSDIKVVLKCNADISETKIANGAVPIRVGKETPVRGKGYALIGYVIEIEER